MKYIKHVPTLKDIKIWFAVIAILVLIPVYSGYLLKTENPGVLISIFLILGFFILNLIVRKSLAFKKYFTSPINLLTSKVQLEKAFDIPKAVMFEKIIEVINHSKFKLAETDKNKFEILATSKISFQSWGENIYINFEKEGNETMVKFCSVTLFQIHSWGKNEKNFDELLREIESSLTI